MKNLLMRLEPWLSLANDIRFICDQIWIIFIGLLLCMVHAIAFGGSYCLAPPHITELQAAALNELPTLEILKPTIQVHGYILKAGNKESFKPYTWMMLFAHRLLKNEQMTGELVTVLRNLLGKRTFTWSMINRDMHLWFAGEFGSLRIYKVGFKQTMLDSISDFSILIISGTDQTSLKLLKRTAYEETRSVTFAPLRIHGLPTIEDTIYHYVFNYENSPTLKSIVDSNTEKLRAPHNVMSSL